MLSEECSHLCGAGGSSRKSGRQEAFFICRDWNSERVCVVYVTVSVWVYFFHGGLNLRVLLYLVVCVMRMVLRWICVWNVPWWALMSLTLLDVVVCTSVCGALFASDCSDCVRHVLPRGCFWPAGLVI